MSEDFESTAVVYTAPNGNTEFEALLGTEVEGGRLAAQTTHLSVYYVGLEPNGSPTVIAKDESYPVGIAVDSMYVCWANDGSASGKLDATWQHQPLHTALDATKGYWTNNGHEPNDGTIMVAAK